jgi:hypothetical protein
MYTAFVEKGNTEKLGTANGPGSDNMARFAPVFRLS